MVFDRFKQLQKEWAETLKDKWGKTPLSVFDGLLKEKGIVKYQEFHPISEREKLPSGLVCVSWDVLTIDGEVQRYKVSWDPNKLAFDGGRGYYLLLEEKRRLSKEDLEKLQDDRDYIFARLRLNLPLTKEQNQIAGNGGLFRYVDKWGNQTGDAIKGLLDERFGKGSYGWTSCSPEGRELPTGFEDESFFVLTKDGKWQCHSLDWDDKKIAPDGSQGYYVLGEGHEHGPGNDNIGGILAKKEIGLPLSYAQEKILEEYEREKSESSGRFSEILEEKRIYELSNVYGRHKFISFA